MKQLFILLVIIIAFASCKKISRTELQSKSIELADAQSSGLSLPSGPYRWVKMEVPPFTRDHEYDPVTGSFVFPLGTDFYCAAGNFTEDKYKLNSQQKWILQPPMNIIFAVDNYPNSQLIFTFKGKIYIGLQFSGEPYPNQFYHIFEKYDPVTGVYTPLAPFPGFSSDDFTAFIIGEKGYIMEGYSSHTTVGHIWEYNFVTDQWHDMGNNPLGNRGRATVIVKDGKAYMGLGYTYITLNGQTIRQCKNDWRVYTPGSPVSGILADFPGEKRFSARGFVLNDEIYLGFGRNSSTGFSDFFKYNPATSSWTRQPSYPGSPVVTSYNTNAFSIGTTGYLLKGDVAEFYKFTNSAF